jgi:hypothetical protein
MNFWNMKVVLIMKVIIFTRVAFLRLTRRGIESVICVGGLSGSIQSFVLAGPSPEGVTTFATHVFACR